MADFSKMRIFFQNLLGSSRTHPTQYQKDSSKAFSAISRMSIRRTKNTSPLQMKMPIAAVLHHCTQKEDEDEDDRHKYCPSDGDTWCKHQRSKIEGVVFKGDRVNISEKIYQLIRPLWLRLSDNVLIEKCMHGRTQKCK